MSCFVRKLRFLFGVSPGNKVRPLRLFAGSYVLAWKRGIAVLTAGPVKVTPDPRVSLLPSPPGTPSLGGIPGFTGGSYSLELKNVRPQDAGDYICQIGTMEPREITHTLEILGEYMYIVKR